MKLSKRAVTHLVVWSAVIACCGIAWVVVATRSSLNIRDRYRDYPPDVLALIEPIEVKETIHWEDGGSIGIVIVDSTGKEFAACLDGSDCGGPYKEMYIGASFPKHEGGRAVAGGGPEEAALFGLLIRWYEADPMSYQVERMSAKEAQDFLVPYQRANANLMTVRGLLRVFESRLPSAP